MSPGIEGYTGGSIGIGFRVKGYVGMGEEDARAVKKGYRGMRGV